MVNQKKVLVIGGTSSITPNIVNKLELNGYTIDLMTFRQPNKEYGNYKWQYLNLEDISSVDNLLKIMPENYYSKILFVSGNSLGRFNGNVPYDELEKFYNAFLLRYNFLIKQSCKSLSEDGQIIYISSIAANVPILDADYSAAKAGVQAFVRSLSCSLKPNQSAFSISPGLIYGSRVFEEMGYSGDVSKLATIDQIASIIVDADKSYNGRVIVIGY